ncbi:MAG TPA: 5-formyltetrahydrofolate cyclo-ligase [Usitatibacter sp.]|nr:5-formyltetrahydrofolate cyclo-ligase [Usitatibacter sp.]
MTNPKSRLRTEMMARRDALPPEERARIAEALTAELTRLPQYAAARAVLATMSIGSEWSTRGFLERARADGKTVVLPRLTEPPRRLALHAVDDLDRHLVPGVWSIPEPDPVRCPVFERDEVDFAVVPALAVDRAGYRLGYGAGYFDRLLAGRGGRPFCVTALPAAFVVESLPHEAHDVAVDLVLDERGARAGARP